MNFPNLPLDGWGKLFLQWCLRDLDGKYKVLLLPCDDESKVDIDYTSLADVYYFKFRSRGRDSFTVLGLTANGWYIHMTIGMHAGFTSCDGKECSLARVTYSKSLITLSELMYTPKEYLKLFQQPLRKTQTTNHQLRKARAQRADKIAEAWKSLPCFRK